MLAKNVFFTVVVVGATYLGYQLFQQKTAHHDNNTETATPSQSFDIDKKIDALQDQIDFLKHEIVLLRSDVTSNLNEKQVAKKDYPVQNVAPAKNTDATDLLVVSQNQNDTPNSLDKGDSKTDASIVSSDVDDKSDLQKRLLQQSQLRAIAEKHELAALNALVK